MGEKEGRAMADEVQESSFYTEFSDKPGEGARLPGFVIQADDRAGAVRCRHS